MAAGGVIVLPTDTVYGVAAALHNEEAVRRIFEIKNRPRDKPLPVLVPSLDEARKLGRFSSEAQAAALSGWPGALTVVVPAAEPLPQLGGDGTSVGLRVPAHPFALAVLERCGALAATSANMSGEPAPSVFNEVRESMADADVLIDGGKLGSSPSKVVSFVGAARVLRP